MDECQLSSFDLINSGPKTLSCTRHATEKRNSENMGAECFVD